MLPINLRIILIVAVCCYFILILLFLKRKALELKYTLLWLLAGVVLGIFVLFPNLLLKLVNLLGIESLMNGLYVLCIGFIIIILMALTSIVSRQTMKIRALIQENAMLEKRLREAEQAIMRGNKIEEQKEVKGNEMNSDNLSGDSSGECME